MKISSFNPKAAGAVQLFDALIAVFDIWISMGHPFWGMGFIAASVWLAALGLWNLSS